MKIVHQLFDSGATDMVAFAEKGEGYSELRNGGMFVSGSLRDGAHFENFFAKRAEGEYGFSHIGMRSYLAGVPGTYETRQELETLFVDIASNSLRRVTSKCKEEAPLQMRIDGSSISCVRTSKDGRYIAIGDGNGGFELWNMDSEPYRYMVAELGYGASISEVAFSRSNLEAMVATTSGDLCIVDTARNGSVLLHSENILPFYSVDGQHEGEGWVFGGDSEVLWFIRTKNVGMDSSVLADDVPFQLERRQTFTGKPYHVVPGLMDSWVGCIRTGVGSYIRRVRFLTDELICVMGPEATEVWSIEGEKPRMVTRKRHDPDCRLLGFGGTEELVTVSLGRPL
jgi:hypothetical protein